MTLAILPADVRALSFPDPALRRLYERAKADQWRIDTDLDPRALDLAGLLPRVRQAMADVYAQIQYGEMLSLVHVSRAVGRMQSSWARQLGATQVMDEARHVEFFSRALASLQSEARVSPHMVAFAEQLEAVESEDEALFGVQIVLEIHAQAVFVEGSLLARRALDRAVVLPGSEAAWLFVDALGRFIGKDEARHVAFGVLYMQHRWRELSASQRRALERRAWEWSALMQGVLDDIRQPLRQLGIDALAVGARAASARDKHLRQIGLSVCGYDGRTVSQELQSVTVELEQLGAAGR